MISSNPPSQKTVWSYLRLANQKLPDVAFLQQLLHSNKGWQEAEDVSHNAQQLGVVLGGGHHSEGIQRRGRPIANHVLSDTCTEERRLAILSRFVKYSSWFSVGAISRERETSRSNLSLEAIVQARKLIPLTQIWGIKRENRPSSPPNTNQLSQTHQTHTTVFSIHFPWLAKAHKDALICGTPFCYEPFGELFSLLPSGKTCLKAYQHTTSKPKTQIHSK